jgi:hypothetical protein
VGVEEGGQLVFPRVVSGGFYLVFLRLWVLGVLCVGMG